MFPIEITLVRRGAYDTRMTVKLTATHRWSENELDLMGAIRKHLVQRLLRVSRQNNSGKKVAEDGKERTQDEKHARTYAKKRLESRDDDHVAAPRLRKEGLRTRLL